MNFLNSSGKQNTKIWSSGKNFFLVLYLILYSIIFKHLGVLSLDCTGKFQQLSFSFMMFSWAFSQTFPMSAVIFNLGPLRLYFKIKPFNSKNTINSGGFLFLKEKSSSPINNSDYPTVYQPVWTRYSKYNTIHYKTFISCFTVPSTFLFWVNKLRFMAKCRLIIALYFHLFGVLNLLFISLSLV